MRYVQQYCHYKQQDLIPQQWCLRRLSSSWPSIGRAYQWAHPERAWMGLGAEAISGGWPGEKDFQVNRNRYLNWPTYQYIPQLLCNTHTFDHLSHYEMAPELWILPKMMRGNVTWILMQLFTGKWLRLLRIQFLLNHDSSQKRGGYIHILSHSLPVSGSNPVSK